MSLVQCCRVVNLGTLYYSLKRHALESLTVDSLLYINRLAKILDCVSVSKSRIYSKQKQLEEA